MISNAQLDLTLQDPLLLGILVLVILWVLLWKGWALWRAARQKNQKHWFVVLLVFNTILTPIK
ncbi:hypothetical protein KJ973_01885 [Patescibacteria group bacterium]|nr:hypothetical protein [Patescibacteria group bacterium]MBU1246730.1 hypothetical protein [Patescibacteria group bacterium]MBU1519424.1 hypothetical protein [Patescibacteria group bacterium]MBU1956523.1 hypothetical protein [Patescibacteria group bacterium]MBU2009922.1 hypothetical protein [Patescibacteria group bacterium]